MPTCAFSARASRRGGIWWLKYHSNGKVYWESSKSEVYADAERLLKRRLGDMVTGKFAGLQPERVKIKQLTELVLQEYKENGKSSVADVESRLRLHLLPEVGAIRVADFGPSTFADTSRCASSRRQQTRASTENWPS